jgi:type I restriction enzyme M protein
MPTNISYAQGVKANVLLFDRKPAAENPWTAKLWIYDLRTNKHAQRKSAQTQRLRQLRRLLQSAAPYHGRIDKYQSQLRAGTNYNWFVLA